MIMKSSSIVETPTLNTKYLVRARLGGAVQERFSPAIVIDDFEDQTYKMRLVKVRWLYTENVQSFVYYHGLIKELDRRWLMSEARKLQKTIDDSTSALSVIKTCLNG